MSAIDHYENFPVASWLCPPRLRPAVLAIYRFARTADDLADEGHEPANTRLLELSEFKDELTQCLDPNHTRDPRWAHIFEPLAQAIVKYQLPVDQMQNLLDAFEQDIIYTATGQRYKTRAELLQYCQRSANTIGRLMLHLYQVTDDASLAQSDAICTALQLINCWQDRKTDLYRSRDYLPLDCTVEEEQHFARELMMQGIALPKRIRGRIGWELRAVVQGGLRILDKLQADIENPSLTRWDKLVVAWRCLRM